MIKASKSFALNLKTVMDHYNIKSQELAKRSGVSPRMVAYILTDERKLTIDTADKLAKALGMQTWHLLLPNFNIELAQSGMLENLIQLFAASSIESKQYIFRVAQRESSYAAKQKEK